MYNGYKRVPMSRAEIALFLSGLFFGGAIDHAILALLHSERTLYGARVGTRGNWTFAGLDFIIAVLGYMIYRHLGPRSNRLSR
jgi:hypothetical protein